MEALEGSAYLTDNDLEQLAEGCLVRCEISKLNNIRRVQLERKVALDKANSGKNNQIN